MKAAEHHCFLHRFLALAAALLLLGGLIFAPALSAPVLADITTQTLRVGYYAYDGFNMIDSDGSYSGYSYDLLQKIARYRNITYEYLGYDGDADDAVALLASGKIDVIPILRKTPEREEILDFTASPIGTVTTMLTVRAGDRSIEAREYDTYDGMVVGFSRDGNGRNQSFINFAADHNFTYKSVFYDTDDELAEALRKGEITAAVSNINRITTDEWVLETFDETPLYMAVRKGDAHTLMLLNDALIALERQEPSWQSALHDKYTSASRSSKLSLTTEEQAYLYSIDKQGKVWTVAANPDRYPYSYLDENGNWAGICVKLFSILAQRAGIRYQLLTCNTRQDYMTLLEDDKADLCLGMYNDLSTAERLHYKLTDPYITAGFSWVMPRSDRTMKTIGTVDLLAKDAASIIVSSRNPVYKTYASFDDCLTALRAGEIDAYYTFTYQAERVLYDNLRNDLTATLAGSEAEFSIGVLNSVNVQLLSILNKSVQSLSDEDIYNVTRTYTTLEEQPFSMTRLAYQYPVIPLLFAICTAFFILCIILLVKARLLRKQMEAALHKAEEASSAKTEFLSNMSHDIRTPINGIMGMLDIAENNFDDQARVKDSLDKMRGAASHLLSLINDVLDMAKVESGTMQMLDADFDLRALLNSCCDITEGQLADRNLTLTKQIGPFWHPHLRGSELHIRQVLLNILSNAVKYTPDGGTINFYARETLFEEGLVHLRIEIADTGIGMSEEFLRHIFEPFTQEQRSSRTTYKGTGLGMAITKKLVDQMHGSLDVVSTPGKGSTFTVRLSLPLAEKANQPDVEEPPADLHGLHLLMAEDNELNREIAVALLEEQGATVTTAENGREAVELYQSAHKGTFDAVLMDVMMPEMNGLEATRAIRAFEHCPAESGIPIIAMTANVFADDVKACLEAGMNSHVGKPLDMQVLAAEISRQVRRYALLREGANFTKLGS